MKAVICTGYGPPGILKIENTDKPVPKENEVLVKVKAAPVNAGDWHLLKGEPFLVRLVFGLTKPKHKIPGTDFAGVVEEVGSGVTKFRPGDEVFGYMANNDFGTYAEYVCAPESVICKKPSTASFEEAASLPVSAMTPLQALRDHGSIKKGQDVLVNGASGGVGSFAVQIAKSYGAEVTGVCSTANVEYVKSLGADEVIDYKKENFTKAGKQYDLIIDTAAYNSLSDYKKVLKPGGRYVMIGGPVSNLLKIMIFGGMMGSGGRKLSNMMMKFKQEDLDALKSLYEEDKLKVHINKEYPLSEINEALEYYEKGGVNGKIVVKTVE